MKEINSCKGVTLTKNSDPVGDITGSEIDQPDIEEEIPADRLTRAKILIIDRLKDPKVFSTSSKILGEFKKYFPDTTLEFAYSLARGGIAIHLFTQEERDYIISTFPAEAFGGGTLVHPLNVTKILIYS